MNFQFFALVYIWASSNPGGMHSFFLQPQNSNIVEQSMNALLAVMKQYDASHAMRLSQSDLKQLFQDILPAHVANYEQTVGEQGVATSS